MTDLDLYRGYLMLFWVSAYAAYSASTTRFLLVAVLLLVANAGLAVHFRPPVGGTSA